MKKNWSLFLIFGAVLSLKAHPAYAEDSISKNPARPISTKSGIPFDVKMSTQPQSPSKDFKIISTTSTTPLSYDLKTSTPVQGEAVAVEPKAAEAPGLAKARTDLIAGNWRGARRGALAYLDDHGKSSEAWMILAQTYSADKKYTRAIRRFNKALKFDSHNAEAFYGKGQAYEAQGKLDEAANEYQAAMRADAAYADARTAWQRIKDQVSVAP